MSGSSKAGRVVVAELVGVGLLLCLDLVATGSPGFFAAAAGAFLGALALLWRQLHRDRGWLTRPALRRVAMASGLAGWVLGAGAYAAAWARSPDLYDFGLSGLFFAAPAVGLLGAFVGLVAPLCAGDAAGALVGGLDDGGEVHGPRRSPPQSSRALGGRTVGRREER